MVPLHRRLAGHLAAPCRILLIALATLILTLAHSRGTQSQGSVVYVDTQTTGPVHNGASWETAYATLSEALAAAQPGAEIWVAQGVYYPSTQVEGDSRTASFVLRPNVAVYGGFVGNEATRSERDWVLHPTVLSGDIDQNDVAAANDDELTDAFGIVGANAYTVVAARDGTRNAILDGFVISAGQATGDRYPYFYGGAIVVTGQSSPVLANLVLSGNEARLPIGGGLYSDESSTPRLSNIRFGPFRRSPSASGDTGTPITTSLGAATESAVDRVRAQGAPVDFYGKQIEMLGLFGQHKVTETGRNFVDGNGTFHPVGVVVDRNSPRDRLYIYVADAANNRILGYDLACVEGQPCPLDASVHATVVIGQPNEYEAACNRDNNRGFLDPPSAATLCLLGYPLANNVAESWQTINLDVDASGNLYVPDRWNNRVLRYDAPLSADKTNGRGDGVADFVWGQDDMNSNGINRGPHWVNWNDQYPPADNRGLWLSYSPYAIVASYGVTADPNGNVWVADTYNNRVLRMPPNSKEADLVLGQPDFSTTGCVANGPLDKMCLPTLARIDPDTGDLYVLEEYASGFAARILVFHPPFSNGMSAARVIVPNQPGPFENWGGWDGLGTYMFQSTGFMFNPYHVGEYAAGKLWVTEHDAFRALLLDEQGNILKIIGARNQLRRGGDVEYTIPCPLIYNGSYVYAMAGTPAIDRANNIYFGDDFFHTVLRYALPYDLILNQSTTCLPEANGMLMPRGPNHESDDRLGEAMGMAAWRNQLYVNDEGNRLKVYDYYQSSPWGVAADSVLRNLFSRIIHMNSGIDHANRLWLGGEHGQIRVFQLPITGSNSAPLGDFIKLYWADTGTQILNPEGTGPVQTGTIAFDPIQNDMYVADRTGTRIFRISNYEDFSNGLVVDMVIGQRNKSEIRCNQGLAEPAADRLCAARQLQFDRLGNLYVVDNDYECHGNRRIVVWTAEDLAGAAGLFPNLPARRVFNAPSLDEIGRCAYWTKDAPGSPISLAFNSRNQMVVGNDGYYEVPLVRQTHQLWFYNDPIAKQTPDAYIDLPMGTPGDVVFDSNDNLIVQDVTWYKVWLINLGCDPEWLQTLPGGTVTELPPCPLDVTYTVTVQSGPHGTISLSTPQTVGYAEPAQIEIFPDAGFRLASLTINDALVSDFPNEGIITYTLKSIIADTVVTATFEAIALKGVALEGPTSGLQGVPVTITATISPTTTITPITYTWSATDMAPDVHVGGTRDTYLFRWEASGFKVINLTATNATGTVQSNSFVFWVKDPESPPEEAVALRGVLLDGPTDGIKDVPITFTATVFPANTTTPITYTWSATDMAPEVHVGGTSDTYQFRWVVSGQKIINLAATNATGTVQSNSVVFWVKDPESPPEDTFVYMPAMMK